MVHEHRNPVGPAQPASSNTPTPNRSSRFRARPFALAAVVLGFAVLTACGPGGRETGGDRGGSSTTGSGLGGIAIDLTLEPLIIGPVSATATVTDGGGALAGATVTVRGDMTHAGMAPSISSLGETEAGVYRTDTFQLQMAGDWLITVDVTTADGRKTSSETFVTVSTR